MPICNLKYVNFFLQYIHPTDCQKLSQAELVVIDEAAAIPLPYVKEMLGPYLVFLASTINGYEGTGRSLSLKLLQQLRTQSVPTGANTNAVNRKDWGAAIGRTLHEVIKMFNKTSNSNTIFSFGSNL